MKFLFICVALCGALAAQTTTRPESAPTSRPLSAIVRDVAHNNALRATHVAAANKRIERLRELVRERSEAFSDVRRALLDDEQERLQAENARAMAVLSRVEDAFHQASAEALAYGVDDVRTWFRANGLPVPDLPDWRYFDTGSIEVISEQLSDWIGFRASLAVYTYVGPWSSMPSAVRIAWRGVDAFGDTVTATDATTEAVLGPVAPSGPSLYFAAVVTGMKLGQATEYAAIPVASTVRITAVKGRSAK